MNKTRKKVVSVYIERNGYTEELANLTFSHILFQSVSLALSSSFKANAFVTSLRNLVDSPHYLNGMQTSINLKKMHLSFFFSLLASLSSANFPYTLDLVYISPLNLQRYDMSILNSFLLSSNNAIFPFPTGLYQ